MSKSFQKTCQLAKTMLVALKDLQIPCYCKCRCKVASDLKEKTLSCDYVRLEGFDNRYTNHSDKRSLGDSTEPVGLEMLLGRVRPLTSLSKSQNVSGSLFLVFFSHFFLRLWHDGFLGTFFCGVRFSRFSLEF